MSYAPGTILSSGFGVNLEEVVMLSDNRVATKTFAGKPVGRRDIIAFSDWQFLVGNQTIQQSYIPLPPAEPAAAAPVAAEPVAAEPVAAAVPVAPAHPIGTKFELRSPGNNQRYVAIQLHDGVLYVKHVFGTETRRPMKKYESYQAWKDAIGGETTVTVLGPQKPVSPIQHRKQRCAELRKGGDTPEAVQAIQKLWRVHSYIHYNNSFNQVVKSTEERIAQLREQLQKATLSDDMENPAYRRRLTRALEGTVQSLRNKKAMMATMSPEQADYRQRFMVDEYKNRLYIHTSKGKVQIAYDSESKSIAARIPCGPNYWNYELKFFPSLEALTKEVGTAIVGLLHVQYRGKEIDL